MIKGPASENVAYERDVQTSPLDVLPLGTFYKVGFSF